MSDMQLTVPSDPSFVALVRLVVGRAARLAGVAPERVSDVKIAVDEAVSNAVRARTASGASSPIDVRFGSIASGFEVVVRGLYEPSAPVSDVSGTSVELLDPKLSFTLIEGLTDEIDYRPDGPTMDLRFVIAFD